MNKKRILIGSTFAVIIIVLASFSSVASAQSTESKTSKLYRISDITQYTRDHPDETNTLDGGWTPGLFFWMFIAFLIELYGVLPHETLLWKILDFFATWIVLIMLLMLKSIYGSGPPGL